MERFFFVKQVATKSYRRINADDVLFVKAVGGKAHVYLENEIVEISRRLVDIEPGLSKFSIIRVSRDTLVSVHKIDTIIGEEITLTVKETPTLRLSRQFKKSLLEGCGAHMLTP